MSNNNDFKVFDQLNTSYNRYTFELQNGVDLKKFH